MLVSCLDSLRICFRFNPHVSAPNTAVIGSRFRKCCRSRLYHVVFLHIIGDNAAALNNSVK